MRSAVVTIALLLSFAACSTTGPTSNGQATDLSGTWTGDFTFQGQAGTMTWMLTQSGTSVAGPIVVALLNGVVLVNGALSGTLNGTTLTYTITIPVGGIIPQPTCSGQLSGTATATNDATMLSGSYTVASSSCPTTFPGGSFTLTKQ